MNPLRKYQGKPKEVRVSRRFPSGENIFGYVIDTSSSLALLHEFYDFFPLGYTIIRAQDITEVRHGAHERFWHDMYVGERLLSGLKLKFRPDLSSLNAAIASIAKKHDLLSVQCEDDTRPIMDFYLGIPVGASEKTLMLDHFDALGRWSRAPSEVLLHEISRVEFDTPYIHRFEKYVRPRQVRAGRSRGAQ